MTIEPLLETPPAKIQPKLENTPIIFSSPARALPSPSKIQIPASQPCTVVGNWILAEHEFAPRREHFKTYCKWLSQRRIIDNLIHFQFKNGDTISVHHSRLHWIGGPLAALVSKKEDDEKIKDTKKEDEQNNTDAIKDKAKQVVTDDIDMNAEDQDESKLDGTDEESKHVVKLEDDETPRTFSVVIKFLYCEEIEFNYLTFDELVILASAAHRWGLADLYQATFSYVMDQNLLENGIGIRTFIPLVQHPETPETFKRYFCIAVGHHFDVLYPRLKANELAAESRRKSLGPDDDPDPIPPLWDVIMKQNMFSHALHCIRMYSEPIYDSYLLDVAMRYYEPRCKDDDILSGILSQLNWDEIDPATIFSSEGASQRWSPRAIRAAAIGACSPQTKALEVHIPWNIPLQRLLRSETWSFQTEHVICGPYCCYLHVRKGPGPEVSLFVHIWNRDGKPLRDDPRHEIVRVKCRATEYNCKCDSSLQFSDTSHGFLESLKFEGALKNYPGLGWSQFLEERRLDEWRNSHGEHCGLAITTVLQFINPSRQFEGPMRKTTRTTSPTRLATPIQKKRTGARMKTRENSRASS